MKTVNAHFDGKVIILDEPLVLKPNTKVKVIAPEQGEVSFMEDCARFSEAAFHKIWDNPLDAEYDKL